MADPIAEPPLNRDLVARWQYALVWRYGALLLIMLGLGLVACAIAGATAVSPDALLPTGIGVVLSGVILPRVSGQFRGPGVQGNLLATHELDPGQFRYTAPAVTTELTAIKTGETPEGKIISLGDLIRDLAAAPDVRLIVDGGTLTFITPDGERLTVPRLDRPGAFSWAEPADQRLIEIAKRWGVVIEATGNPRVVRHTGEPLFKR